MATLKHLASKSADYGKPIKYLMFEHDRNGTPLRDADGNLIMRDSFILDGINCTPLYFDKECEMLNWQYRKNQNYNDIKSHHYILSFDPKDKEEGLLDPAHAHELGMEFAQRCFPGHQILVCTHSDGHHGSGNIHVHLILNSLRKLDVKKQPFMERDIDSRAGYKHNLTPGYLKYMQSQVMKICEREGLHQVDLLTPAKTKITNAEYEARESGQIAMDARNEKIRAAQMIPRNTVFRTQKQFLRDAILDAADHSTTLEEFRRILKEKYGIELKDRRGRFSYLHPDRKKFITGRALGTDYEKECLLERIQKICSEKDNRSPDHPSKASFRQKSIPSQKVVMQGNNKTGDKANQETLPVSEMTGEKMAAAYCAGKKGILVDYNPSYDYHADPVAILFIRTELRLVVDLQTNIKAQMNTAYARKAKISNLKEMARTVVYIQELGIHSREELKEKQAELTEQLKGLETRIRNADAETKDINQQIHFAGQYYANRAVHSDFMKSWKKGWFRSTHRNELDRYDEAVSFFKDNNAGNIPLIKDLKEKKEILQSQKQEQLTSRNTLLQAQRNLQTASANVDAILGIEEAKVREVPQIKQSSRNTDPSL